MNCKKSTKFIESIVKFNAAFNEKTKNNAVKMLICNGLSRNTARQFVDNLPNLIPSLRGANKYVEGIIRWHVEGQIDLNNSNDIKKIELFLRAFKVSTVSFIYDGNFESDSAKATFETLRQLTNLDLDADIKEVDDIEGFSYEIIEIQSFMEFLEYVKYVPNWCIAQSEEVYDAYVTDGKNRLYLILREDFKNMPAIPGEQTPFDAYGFSVMCAIKNPDNQIISLTSRWNSCAEDEIFIAKSELKLLIGEKNAENLYKKSEF